MRLTRAMQRALRAFASRDGAAFGEGTAVRRQTAEALEARGLVMLGRNNAWEAWGWATHQGREWLTSRDAAEDAKRLAQAAAGASPEATWGVWCIRRAGGHAGLGHDECWLKVGTRWDRERRRWDESRTRVFRGTEAMARAEAARLNQKVSSFVLSYSARELPQEVS